MPLGNGTAGIHWPRFSWDTGGGLWPVDGITERQPT